MARLSLKFFGSFQATLVGRPLRGLQSVRLQALLAYLVLERTRPHSRNELAARFWPEEADLAARQNLRQALYQLRQALDDLSKAERNPILYLLITRESVQFNQASDYTLDVATFIEKINTQEFEAAIALYQGELLPNVTSSSPLFEEWLIFMRERFHIQALSALEQLACDALQVGHFTQAEQYARQHLALEPWHESAHRQIMLALAYSGDRAAALLQYATCRQRLLEELGVEPDGETEGLVAQIRAGTLPSAPLRGEVAGLLTPGAPPVARPAAGADHVEPMNVTATSSQLPSAAVKQIDWGEAPDVTAFHGRQAELVTLGKWLVDDRCRLVAVVAMGGMGKTTLAVRATQQVAAHFDVLIWRSLLNAPPLEELLHSWLRLLDEAHNAQPSQGLATALTSLFGHLQARRCLLILDNVESILESDTRAGHYRPGYTAYGQFFKRLGETNHQSTLLLTSRETPPEVAQLARERPTVQTMALRGLAADAGQAILRRQGTMLARDAVDLLVERYSGNPLALMLVGETIQELFDGDVAAFLDQPLIFDDIRDVLDQQWLRLAPLERDLLLWLAIEREPLTLAQLGANLHPPVPMPLLVETIHSLRRRSLLEKADEVKRAGGASPSAGFLLQNVVIEYLTALFVEEICREVETALPWRLHRHALLNAQAKEFVRQSQRRLLLAPIAEQLRSRLGETQLAAQINLLLTNLRLVDQHRTGYGAGNLLNLLLQLGFDGAIYDFAGLTIRQADLADALVQGVNFRGCHFAGCRFTDQFAAITALTFSADGQQLVAGTAVGNIRLWRVTDGQPLGVWQAHTNYIFSVLASPDGTSLYSCSDDQSICCWEWQAREAFMGETPVLRYRRRSHQRGVWQLALSSEGRLLASAGGDGVVILWDAATGTEIRRLHEHRQGTRAVAIDPTGQLIAAGGEEGLIVIWRVADGAVLARLHEHRSNILALAFSPDGTLLASGSHDRTIRLWQLTTLTGVERLRAEKQPAIQAHTTVHTLPSQTLTKQQSQVTTVAFSPDGSWLASGSADQKVYLWQVGAEQARASLYGHGDAVARVAFSPDGRLLASGSADRSLCLWNVANGQLLQRLHGHVQGVMGLALTQDGSLLASAHQDRQVRLWDPGQRCLTRLLPLHQSEVTTVDWQPQGQLLASGSVDQTIRFWEQQRDQVSKVLYGHAGWLRMVRFNRAGSQLISCSNDWSIRHWQVESGALLQTIEPGYSVWAIALSPDEATLACGGTQGTVQLLAWPQGTVRMILHGHSNWVTVVAFSPDGTILASGGGDQQIRLWDAQSGHCLATLQGHSSWIYGLAFSPDGLHLASASADHTICLWALHQRRLRHTLRGHSNEVRAVVFSPDGRTLISGSVDETLRWWDVATGESLATRYAPRPYEGMQIAGATGLTAAQMMTLSALGAGTA